MSDQTPGIKPLFSPAAVVPNVIAPVVAETSLSSTLRTTFRFLYVVVAILAVVWLGSGIRPVEPGMQAVIFRSGAIDRTQTAGLVLAWPRPFEEIVLVPGAERQLSLEVTSLDLLGRDSGSIPNGPGIDPRKDGGFILTGDSGVVHLRGTVTYGVSDARAYVLNRERATVALQRAFLAATITACAGRSLDGVMVASPNSEDLVRSESLAMSRERLRGDILAGTNHRLVDLGIGITASRIDLTAYLPDRAKPSFDAVIAAESSAAKEIAEARTFATKQLQDTEAARAQVVADASGKAQEMLTAARVATDRINSVLAESSPERRALLITRLYSERFETIIKNAAGVVTVPEGQSARLLVQGR